jgi:DNA-binding transcriptional ArsR family regulator
MQPAGEVFHAIADANRRKLLDVLAACDLPAQELASRLDISFAAISQHLKVLRDAGLVKRRAAGRQRIYSLAVTTAGSRRLDHVLSQILAGPSEAASLISG